MTQDECRFDFPWRSCKTHEKGYGIGDSEHPVICDLGLAALRAQLSDLDFECGKQSDSVERNVKEIDALQEKLADQARVIEAIIYASDGCKGHRGCNHSMKPWQDARALITETEPPHD